MAMSLNRQGWLFCALMGATPLPLNAQQLCPETEDRTGAFVPIASSCVKAEVGPLVKSGESPADIATAAIFRCQNAFRDLRSAAQNCGGDKHADDTIKSIKSALREAAITEVVVQRAAIKSANR